MFEIYNTTKDCLVGYVEQPRYIYLSPNGSYVQCDEQVAQGIAYKSIPYNLAGREALNAEVDTVILREVDAGELFNELQQRITMLMTKQEG